MGWLQPFRAPDFPTWRDVNAYYTSAAHTVIIGVSNTLMTTYTITFIKNIFLIQVTEMVEFREQVTGAFYPEAIHANVINVPLGSSGVQAASLPEGYPYIITKSGEHRTVEIMKNISAGTTINILSGFLRTSVPTVAVLNAQMNIGLYYIITN